MKYIFSIFLIPMLGIIQAADPEISSDDDSNPPVYGKNYHLESNSDSETEYAEPTSQLDQEDSQDYEECSDSDDEGILNNRRARSPSPIGRKNDLDDTVSELENLSLADKTPVTFPKVFLAGRPLTESLTLKKIKPVQNGDNLEGYIYEAANDFKVLHLTSEVKEDGMYYRLQGERGMFEFFPQKVRDSVGNIASIQYDEFVCERLKKDGCFDHVQLAIMQAGKSVKINTSTGTFGFGIISSESMEIFCASNRSQFEDALFRTPIGIFLDPVNKERSIFQRILITPKKFNYPRIFGQGQLQESQTASLTGYIDFITGEVDLKIINGQLSFTFNKNLIPQTS